MFIVSHKKSAETKQSSTSLPAIFWQRIHAELSPIHDNNGGFGVKSPCRNLNGNTRTNVDTFS